MLALDVDLGPLPDRGRWPDGAGPGIVAMTDHVVAGLKYGSHHSRGNRCHLEYKTSGE